MQLLIMLFEAYRTSVDVNVVDYLSQNQHRDTTISHNNKQ